MYVGVQVHVGTAPFFIPAIVYPGWCYGSSFAYDIGADGKVLQVDSGWR